ncbi:MAG: hypothetical protein KF830_14540 [Planctomycetes bacterium]|nr:hypothetical protein [Planctomycetota bacterium]
MTGSHESARLRSLLHDAASPPAALLPALAEARRALAGDGPLAHELVDAELRWLRAQPEVREPGAAAALAALRRTALAQRVRDLAAAGDGEPAVLFDLAEARAAAAALAAPELVLQCDQAIAAAVPRTTGGEALDQEASERFALLSTAIDEVAIDHQVRLLRSASDVAGRVGAQVGSPVCQRLGRRLARAADDRELARRLEAIVGARGLAAIETTNFVLLLVVLATLLVEATVDLSPGQALLLHGIDAAACLFFVADFLFELALHPRRGSWFLRNAVTDLLPAIPSVLFLLPGSAAPGLAGNLVALRVLRLLRVTWAARYVQALRPLLRSARLLLFLVRGLDGLAARFAQLLDREFVFAPARAGVPRKAPGEDRRDLSFAALQREHDLLALLPAAERAAAVRGRLDALAAALAALRPCIGSLRPPAAAAREVPIDVAIEFLWALRPQDVRRWLRPTDLASLDRVLRVLSAVPVRWLPIVRRLAVHPLPPSPEERIVQLGRRIAEWLEAWHGRLLFLADLHGIVTGPQILDRVASAMVKASQRPAVRLLLFGGLFSVLRLFWADNCLSRIVGLPLVLLGGVCLVFLAVGHWLKRLAGQAAETYRLTSEAHFISQLERIKPRYEAEDLAFLARRVFGADGAAAAERALREQLRSARTGVPVADASLPLPLRLAANRVVLLYLHFLDGAPLHETDVKTTEQLLANHSLENLRQDFLACDGRERRRLRRLRLDDGTLLSGPYLWFRFITESVAVESAKRIAGYNQFCVPLAARATAMPAQLAAMQAWLERRRDPRGGRTAGQPGRARRPARYATTEFTALDFVGAEPQRDQYIAAVFGDEVLDVLRADRRTMVREIFGTRPVEHLPRHERSFNPLRFHRRRLSNGRVLLAPLLLLWRLLRTAGWLVQRVRQIVREVIDPELAMQRREIGAAPFAVALRKIHRMKAPGLREAIRMRLALDPVYAGAPPGWSLAEPFADLPEVERDIAFLHLRERSAAALRERAAAVRQQVAELHAALAWLPELGAPGDDDDARLAGELAVTAAWIADKDGVRTLLAAERWRLEVLPALLRPAAAGRLGPRLAAAGADLFGRHPVDCWLERHGQGLPRAARWALRRAYAEDRGATRRLLDAWARLPAGASPAATAIAGLRDAYRQGAALQRDLQALRAVQSLAVLDVRNYRDLVFQLGDYAADGEDPRLVGELP